MTTQEAALCRMLDWDTAFFNVPIASIVDNKLTPVLAPEIDRWCAANGVKCLYLLAGVNDRETVALAEGHGYHLVDIRMTFARGDLSTSAGEPRGEPSGIHVEQVRVKDVETLKAIARVSYTDSRFYYDGNFPKALCDLFYETWIERSCSGYADLVLVARLEDRPCGFITLNIDHDKSIAQIGLVGVSTGTQGRGIGKILVQSACVEMQAIGMQGVSVVTQGRNLAAQRLYQRCGFLTQSVALWYHKWYDI